MAKILTATQVKKLKFEGSGKLKAYSIDSTCALYLVVSQTAADTISYAQKEATQR